MMTWLSLLLTLVKLVTLLTQRAQRQELVGEIEQVERARLLLEINKRLAEASQVPPSLLAMTDEELTLYVERKRWFRD